MRLRGYQVEAVEAVVEACLQRRGLEFLWIFPRQSGKDEAIAHMVVYLMFLLQRRGGNIIHVYPTFPQISTGLNRLEARLDNPLTTGRWLKAANPARRSLGKVSCTFFSAHPQAKAEGATAHPLLIINETQDTSQVIIDRRFNPMRAANNATCLYVGTVRTNSDFLWQVKSRLERLQAGDGRQRLFMVSPEIVGRENPAYLTFVQNQVQLLGRQHPLIKSEYFNEPFEAAAGLFPARRRALMLGQHRQQRQPEAGRRYLGLIDVGGQDESYTNEFGQLENPQRDYTVCTIAEIQAATGADELGPTYLIQDVFVDHGSRHFQSQPGQPSLLERLVAYLRRWSVAAIIVDATGVGQGLSDALAQRFPPGKVFGFNFAQNHNKARLGNDFLALVETGRFRYFQNLMMNDEYGMMNEKRDSSFITPHSDFILEGGPPGSDAWWFFTQCQHCGYELREGLPLEKGLKWGVSPAATVELHGRPTLVHDDRLLSAALVAEADRLYRTGQLVLASGESVVIRRDVMGEIDRARWN
jgi:hypothetical protein